MYSIRFISHLTHLGIDSFIQLSPRQPYHECHRVTVREGQSHSDTPTPRPESLWPGRSWMPFENSPAKGWYYNL